MIQAVSRNSPKMIFGVDNTLGCCVYFTRIRVLSNDNACYHCCVDVATTPFIHCLRCILRTKQSFQRQTTQMENKCSHFHMKLKSTSSIEFMVSLWINETNHEIYSLLKCNRVLKCSVQKSQLQILNRNTKIHQFEIATNKSICMRCLTFDGWYCYLLFHFTIHTHQFFPPISICR